jgi:glycosyltransferase involved in cell wall biosynthesis
MPPPVVVEMVNRKNRSHKKKLLVAFGYFTSFSSWKDAGFLSRMVEMYGEYSKNFEKIYIKSYENSKFQNLPPNAEHMPFEVPFKNISLRKLFYLFFSGIINYNPVDYVEVEDSTAFFSALIYKIRGSHIFLYHKWDMHKSLEEISKPFLGFIANIIQILAFKLADTIAVTTKTLSEDVRKQTNPSKIYLLPNYVDTARFKPIETEKMQNLLIFVGRLHQQKNLLMLLQVMEQLPQFKLQIIGEGPLQDELIAIKNKNKIENVEFLGMIPHEKLSEYLNKAEAFILVSPIEGHPKALIEAMSCGLPCIGSNVEGISDVIVDGETGVLCERNVEDIKRCILNLFADREKMDEVGNNARRFVMENYTMEKILERRIKLIKGELDGIKPLFSDVIDTGRKIN